MPPIDSGNPSRVFTLMLVVAVVAVLYLAQDVLIPFALAILFTFLLAPVVIRLERWHLGRVGSVLIVVLIAFLIVSVVMWLVIEQAIDVGDHVPEYRGHVLDKLESLRDSGGVLGKIHRFFDALNESMADPKNVRGNGNIAVPPVEGETPPQYQVEIVEHKQSAWSAVSASLPFVMSLLGNTGVVVLFVVFMLIEREGLRNRLIRLIGPGQISVTTQAMDDAARRVSKYLRAQLIVNASYGLILAVGLFAIGIPNSLLWGLVAALLRYIPYAGPWIAAAGPLALSLAAFDKWSVPLETLALFVLLELISNNVMEPILYRTSTGISTIGILVAAVFWTWLWGAVGLVLATPLTVCIAVMGRYVRQLEFLNILLSDEPVLSPSAHYYQRLLAGDHNEAETLLEQQLAAGSLEQVYTEALLPVLEMAEDDRYRGQLDDVKHTFILESVRESLAELPDRLPREQEVEGPPAAAPIAAQPFSERSVLCLPAHDEADELASEMLSQLLTRHGSQSESVSVKSLASEMLELVEQRQVGAVCISAIPPFAVSHSRYLCKRLRTRFPQLKIVVGLWQSTELNTKTEERLRSAGADRVITSLPQAVKEL